ncbi:uncharacterized protein VTP21DRAFT_2918 [Calcarisporiella thermophila]|uniref:uncharacterized protein n=1 Tax=Calcarisporiella thermophila TaxID=911321 RepID=UPI00374292A4
MKNIFASLLLLVIFQLTAAINSVCCEKDRGCQGPTYACGDKLNAGHYNSNKKMWCKFSSKQEKAFCDCCESGKLGPKTQCRVDIGRNCDKWFDN